MIINLSHSPLIMNKLAILLTLAVLAGAVSCNGQKRSEENNLVDLNSVYEKNITDSTLVTGWYFITEDNTGFKRLLDKSEEVYSIDPKPILINEHFDKYEIYETEYHGVNDNGLGLSIRISKKYAYIWADATEKTIGKRLGLVIDNVLVNAPKVNMRIEGGMTSLNRGVYTREELEAFIKKIK